MPTTEDITAAYRAGFGIDRIASELGISRRTVLRRLAAAKRNTDRNDDDHPVKASGYTRGADGKQYRRGDWRRRGSIERLRLAARALDMHNAGVSYEAIAVELGVSAGAAYNLCRLAEQDDFEAPPDDGPPPSTATGHRLTGEQIDWIIRQHDEQGVAFAELGRQLKDAAGVPFSKVAVRNAYVKATQQDAGQD